MKILDFVFLGIIGFGIFSSLKVIMKYKNKCCTECFKCQKNKKVL